MTVGERIKQRREELGLTQEELANRMGYSGRSSICKAETMDDSNMNTGKVAKYARALHCSPKYLMGWSDEVGTGNEEKAIKKDMYDRRMDKLVSYYYGLSEAKKKKYIKMFEMLLDDDDE